QDLHCSGHRARPTRPTRLDGTGTRLYENTSKGVLVGITQIMLPSDNIATTFRQITPLYQDLTSSVDLCQILPKPLIQHNGSTCLNLEDRIREEPYHTYLFHQILARTRLLSCHLYTP